MCSLFLFFCAVKFRHIFVPRLSVHRYDEGNSLCLSVCLLQMMSRGVMSAVVVVMVGVVLCGALTVSAKALPDPQPQPQGHQMLDVSIDMKTNDN